MARVVLFTTGRMEELALGASLKRLFPAHDFVAKPRLDGFTCNRLPPDFAALSATQRMLLNIDKFAKSLIGVFAPGGRKDRPPADHVLAVEDVELVNADAPENITRTVREAIERNLAGWGMSQGPADRVRDALQKSCSFHLMAPMTEAYFFADPGAFGRATAGGPCHPNRFERARDVEDFEVADESYLAEGTPVDWRTSGRERHPKQYVRYLTDPALDGKYRYSERENGADALRALDWAHVLRRAGREHPCTRFARSLLADLRELLDELPEGLSDSDLERDDCQPLTWPPPQRPVLRNL